MSKAAVAAVDTNLDLIEDGDEVAARHQLHLGENRHGEGQQAGGRGQTAEPVEEIGKAWVRHGQAACRRGTAG